MSKPETHTTQHSLIRIKERFGIKNPRSSARLVTLAWERGIGMSEFRSKYERSFLTNLCHTENVKPIVYQDFIFLFDFETQNCVTVFRTPNSFSSQRRKTAKTNKHAKHFA